MTYTITKNEQFNSLEINFNGKPSAAIRDALKALKFRWHGVKKVWYGYTDEETARKAIDGTDGELVVPESSFVDGGGLYDGWKGGNYTKWRSIDELKTCLLQDFKKAGIKATVSRKRAGYLTAIHITMTIYNDEIRPFSEWYTGDNFLDLARGRYWFDYTDETGFHSVHRDKFFYDLTDAERAEMEPKLARAWYDLGIKYLVDSCCLTKDQQLLTEPAAARFDLLQKIVDSYNKDCSHIEIDYFDRAIYDSYNFKVIDR